MNRLLFISSCIFLLAACTDEPQTIETRTCLVTYTGADLEDEAKALARFYQMPDYDPMGETRRPMSLAFADDRIATVIAVNADASEYELFYKLQAAALRATVFKDQPFDVQFTDADGTELFSTASEQVPLRTSHITNELYYDRSIPQEDVEQLKTLLDNRAIGDEITLYAGRTTAGYAIHYMIFSEAVTERDSFYDILKLKTVREEAAKLKLDLPTLAFLVDRSGRKLTE